MRQIKKNSNSSVVNIPTRVTETTQTAIDHILTNIITDEIKPKVLQTDISDHFPTYVYISNHKISHYKKHEMLKRNLKKFDSETFAVCVSMKLKNYFHNLEHINKVNINKVCEDFVQVIKNGIDKLVPMTISLEQRKLVKKPWLTKGI